jgi:hypothetical protein
MRDGWPIMAVLLADLSVPLHGASQARLADETSALSTDSVTFSHKNGRF